MPALHLSKQLSIYLQVLLITCFVSASSVVYSAQDSVNFHAIKNLNSDSDFETYAIRQDKKGYQWLGTSTGLKRFDGTELLNLNADTFNALKDKVIIRLKIINNKLWIGCTTGLYSLNLSNYQLKQHSQFNKSYILRISSANGAVWVGTLKSGLYWLPSDTNTFLPATPYFEDNDKRTMAASRSVASVQAKQAWVSTNLGLSLFDISKKSYIAAQHYPAQWSTKLTTLARQKVNDIMVDSQGRLIVISNNMLYQFSKDLTSSNTLALPCENNKPCSFDHLKQGPNQEVWLQRERSDLLQVSKNRDTVSIHSVQTKSLLDSTFQNFIISNSGEISLASFQQGIIKGQLSSGIKRTIHLDQYNSALAQFTPNFHYQGTDGKIWMAGKQWLVAYSPRSNKIESYPIPEGVMYFAVDKHSKAWLLNYKNKSLVRLDLKTGLIDKPIKDDIYYLKYSHIDGLWLVVRNFELLKVNPTTLSTKLYKTNDCLSGLRQVWMNTIQNGLLSWSSGGNLCQYNRLEDNFFKTHIVGETALSFDRTLYSYNNQYWAFEPDVKIIHKPAAGSDYKASPLNIQLPPLQLDSDPVFGDNFIWMKNKKGNRVYTINFDSRQVSYHSTVDGFPRSSASQLLGFYSTLIKKDNSSSTLIVSEPGKILHYSPKQLPRPNIHSIIIHSASILQDQEGERTLYNNPKLIKLSYQDYSIRLSFGTFRTSDSTPSQNYYRLKGRDEHWIKTNRNFVRFSGLAPGEYTFQVKQHLHSKAISNTTLLVEPPPWEQWWAYTIYALVVGSILGFVILQRVNHNRHLKYLANFDTLTNLPNRYHITEYIDKLTQSGEDFALLFIDIDRFKTINDSLGHQVGDQLLVSIADRLHKCLNADQKIARLGGDEFLVITPYSKQDSTSAPCETAKTLLSTINEAIELENKLLYVSLSIGIALHPEDGFSIALLMSCADAAMYQSKSRGGNCFSYYTAKLGQASLEALNLESELYQAMKSNHFVPFYQPKIELNTGNCVGFEVLARWQSPSQGLIYPGNFISTAERTGVIVEISWQLMHKVCIDVERWHRQGIALPVAVNISAQQLALSDFSQQVSRMLNRYDFDPLLFQFEVTESMLIRDKEHSIRQLNILKNLGHKIFVDDFGTGYSSLSYLKELPIDVLKIDQSFIKDVSTDRHSQNIVITIIELAKRMGLELVAEGVEDAETAEYIFSLGCNISQGFHHSHALPASKAVHFLTNDSEQAKPSMPKLSL